MIFRIRKGAAERLPHRRQPSGWRPPGALAQPAQSHARNGLPHSCGTSRFMARLRAYVDLMGEDLWADLADQFADEAYASVKGYVRTYVMHHQLLEQLPPAP